MIGLVDFLAASGLTFNAGNTKVHLACFNGNERPIEVFVAGQFQSWQESQTKQNFECEHIVSLIDNKKSKWLFASVYDVLGQDPERAKPGEYCYRTHPRQGYEELIGRVVVEHVRSRASYIWLKSDIKLPILQIREQKLTVGEFPGYN